MMWISKITRLSRTTFIHHELSSTNGIRISVWIRTPYHHHPTKRKYEQNFKMQSHKKYNSHVEFQMQAKNIQVYELIIILLGTDEVNKRGLFSLSLKKKKERETTKHIFGSIRQMNVVKLDTVTNLRATGAGKVNFHHNRLTSIINIIHHHFILVTDK